MRKWYNPYHGIVLFRISVKERMQRTGFILRRSDGNSNTQMLTLKWGSEEYTKKYGSQTPIFRMEFMAGAVSIGDSLYISLCSGREHADEANMSFQIKLTDSAGNTAIMSINDFGGVINPNVAPVFKPLISAIVGEREPVLQMVCIPTEQFEGLRGDVIGMEWIIDAGEAGKTCQILYADDLRVEREVAKIGSNPRYYSIYEGSRC